MIPWLLNWISSTSAASWGPLRLVNSHFFLATSGFIGSLLATWLLLPRFWHRLPRDRGRAHAVEANKSIGKPLSGGLIFVSIFITMVLLFVPVGATAWYILPPVVAAVVLGYYDDKVGGLHEYKLAIVDLVISLVTVLIIFGAKTSIIWVPFVSTSFSISPWINIPLMTCIIWISINATNCSDGVDGLSGSLTALTLFILGVVLYVVTGNAVVAKYLLVPHDAQGASWSLLAFLMVGCLVSYLWYNAAPSLVLMGDSGSRPLGLLIGILVSVTRNPLFIAIVALVILMNGATGLVKVAAIRFLRIRIFQDIRFPLHDHCRANLKWSNAQVLMRFVLMHIAFSAVLLALVLKIR